MTTWIESSFRVSGFLGCTLASYVAGFVIRRQLLRWRVVDRPNERSSHTKPTPRGGGLGIILVAIGSALLALNDLDALSLILGMTTLTLAAVSFADDRVNLPWQLRFSVQSLCAAIAVTTLWRTGGNWPDSHVVTLGMLSGFVVVCVWYANVFNFMDGINGLATGQAVITGIGTIILGVSVGLSWDHPAIILSVLIVGAAAGFLPHNFPRAQMFMGDVGSVPLGFHLAILMLWIARDGGWWLLLPGALLHANFLLDATITLLQRVLRGETWHQAHREHFYQRLVRAGYSHTKVTCIEMVLQASVIVMLPWYVASELGQRALFALSVVGLWSLFFANAARRFQRSQTSASK